MLNFTAKKKKTKLNSYRICQNLFDNRLTLWLTRCKTSFLHWWLVGMWILRGSLENPYQNHKFTLPLTQQPWFWQTLLEKAKLCSFLNVKLTWKWKNTPSLNRANVQKAEMQLFFPSWARMRGGVGRGGGDPHGTQKESCRDSVPTWIWVPPLLCLWANPLTSLSAAVPGTLFRNVTSQNSHKYI